MEIKITRSPNADSRTAEFKVTKYQLWRATVDHQLDVAEAIKFIIDQLQQRSALHDHTKVEYLDDFYEAFMNGNVKDSEWYKMHITKERHHLKRHVPDDVNIIDVIECIVDCTMAGMARSGEIWDIDLDKDLLVKAINNTVELLKQNTKVVDRQQNFSNLSIHNEPPLAKEETFK